MAQNEYEPAALGVYANGKDLTNVRVRSTSLRARVGGCRCVPGKPASARPSMPWSRTARLRAGGSSQPDQPQTGEATAIFPQRLWPMYATQIQKGQSGWFWVTFQSDPEDDQPGLYRGKAVISADQGSGVLEIRVRVLPIQLVDMNEADLLMGGCISGLLPRHDMEKMVQYNHNMINLWLSGVQPTIMAKGKDDFDLDFTLMDDFMAQARRPASRPTCGSSAATRTASRSRSR